jgi:phage tail-like protein
MTFGTPRSFHKKFKFVIEIDNVAHAGFNKCSELEAEIGKIEYREGGSLIPDKSPGLVTVSDLTLERGAANDDDLYNWWLQVVDIQANAGLKDPQYKRNLDIVQLDRDGDELRRWGVTGAWPTKFTAGDWDNDAEENVIEKMIVTIDTFARA